MVENRYYLWTGASLTTFLLGASGIPLGNSLILGITLALSYILYRKSVKTARLNGRTEKSRILHAATGNMIEFAGITAAFFFIDAWPVVFALVSIGFGETFLQQLENHLHLKKSELLGRLERVMVLGFSFVAAYFNSSFLVYGLLAVGSMALIETGRQLFVYLKK